MAQFDVYAHPDARMRERTPYLLDVQNSFLDRIVHLCPCVTSTLFAR